ncbi:Phospholipase/carboxylesterase/thioesterase [Annulohypoxylon maeteangense]|uniref:Phospholipase/carboxylesterase/thioesterase n=1 Tax=Annulohypoxylon maeteangense TaxID=1927788 RepID=UPI0020081CE0|nr:Phospholipase/carboxylesterase/thioesterase [Annulohypoxylon maeteangense]KAI0886016.1 Phospholipase/carboxylesterase/thioesterase [Annulohypoxylon maeteangense]
MVIDIQMAIERKTDAITVDPRPLHYPFPTVRWIFPSAPNIHSERTGQMIPQWFDTWSTINPDEKPRGQTPGLQRTIKIIEALLEKELKHVPHERIFLGGFGHGFAAAYAACFCLKKRFAGLISFNG